jgi:hypothetical protein
LKHAVDKDGNKMIGNYKKDEKGNLIIEDENKNKEYEPPKKDP